MEANSSYGTSWADQWDDGPDPVPAGGKKTLGGSSTSGGSAAKYKQKVGEGLGKTKTAASHGVKKVKEGTSVGIQWIKTKYQKTTQKH
ncbi:uncharacterized protein LOC116212885 [Punica granatum]|uniref:CDP-diacylglycerol-glycerol-3-phosphate 3-phosphatidyltransferase n=2 Tax=Punica granatum TaxID=22663 RepID=A0A218VY75_PUNGR|nr:uncharacterized protein LOC116212885 [Punica granatum]OWM65366.1 hypothetical protein CDL15_Pgr008956 [Punica granatum]PKI63148.1 hypothetical protein CRG98_016333 [Punica granatum]